MFILFCRQLQYLYTIFYCHASHKLYYSYSVFSRSNQKRARSQKWLLGQRFYSAKNTLCNNTTEHTVKVQTVERTAGPKAFVMLILTESTMELNVREAIAFTNSDMHHLIVRCNQKSDSIQFIESFALLLKTHFICVLISCYLVTKAVVVTDCAAFWGTLIFKGSQATEAVSYIMAAAAITTVLCSRINITGNCSLDVNT